MSKITNLSTDPRKYWRVRKWQAIVALVVVVNPMPFVH